MRLWSVHPKYLDRQGLLALWREGLLAQDVLLGKTKGYKNHPQLMRFKAVEMSLDAIGVFLVVVWLESLDRNYNFNGRKIHRHNVVNLNVTDGQIKYEVRHLQKKLLCRDFNNCIQLTKDSMSNKVALHPMFILTAGQIEEWERI